MRHLGDAPGTRGITVAPGGAALDVGAIALGSATARLEPVTVTAARSPIAAGTSPLPTSALGEERLRREHGVALARAVDRLPGVRAITSGEAVAKPVVRGLAGPRVLVLDDGLRLEDYSWSDEDGPAIDVRLAQRVEVVRGPASLLYGSDAVGGVVNAIPAELPDAVGRDRFVRGGAELYAASVNRELGAVLRGEGASGAFGWRGVAIGRFAEDLQTPAGALENTGFEVVNGELAVGRRHARGTSSLRYARYGGEFKLLESEAQRPEGAPAEEEGPERKMSDDRVQFTGAYALGDAGARLETRAQWQRHSIAELSDDLARFPIPGGTPPSNGGRDQKVFDLLLNTLTADVLYHAAPRGVGVLGTGGLTLGISGTAQKSDTRGPIALVPDASTNGGAAFAVAQSERGRVRLLAGGRVDVRAVDADANAQLGREATSRSWTAGSGDVGAVVAVGGGVSLVANLAHGWRAPTLFELFADGPRLGEARYEVGSDDLDAERATTFDGGLRWSAAKVNAEVSAFRSAISDFIYVTPTEETRLGFPVWRYAQDDARLTGGELSAEVRPVGPLALRGRFDVVRATNEATSEPLPQIPPARGAFEAEVRRSRLGFLADATIGAEVEHVAESSRAAPNELQTDAYTLLHFDAGAEIGIGGRAYRLTLRVRNALDESYRDFLSRYKGFALDAGRNVVFRISTGL